MPASWFPIVTASPSGSTLGYTLGLWDVLQVDRYLALRSWRVLGREGSRQPGASPPREPSSKAGGGIPGKGRGEVQAPGPRWSAGRRGSSRAAADTAEEMPAPPPPRRPRDPGPRPPLAWTWPSRHSDSSRASPPAGRRILEGRDGDSSREDPPLSLLQTPQTPSSRESRRL